MGAVLNGTARRLVVFHRDFGRAFQFDAVGVAWYRRREAFGVRRLGGLRREFLVRKRF